MENVTANCQVSTPNSLNWASKGPKWINTARKLKYHCYNIKWSYGHTLTTCFTYVVRIYPLRYLSKRQRANFQGHMWCIYMDTRQENIISLNFKIHLKASSKSNDTFFSLQEQVEQWGFSQKRKKELNSEFLIPDLPDWCLINHTKNKNYNIAFKVFC